MQNKLSIIVPVFNRPELARVCIDSIKNYTTDYELILVWEGADSDVGKLMDMYDVKKVHNDPAKGFAGAMNSGLALATGNLVCFLNDDTVVVPNWDIEIRKAFEDEKVGLVSPVLPESEGVQSLDLQTDREILEVSDPLSLKGVCFIVRKTILDKIDGYDEKTFELGGGEDNDLCIRVINEGYKLVVARKCIIHHYGSASFRKLFNNDIEYSKKYSAEQFNKVRNKWSMGKDKPSVFLTIPCSDGSINHELALRLIQWTHDSEINLKVKFYPNLAPLDNARNRAVKDFLEGYDDYFMHIDDDIVPPINAIRELLLADKDIIAPLCFTMQQGDDGIQFPQIVAHRYDEDMKYRPFFPKQHPQGIHETDVVTGGCHLVKREVLEKLERPYYFTYHKNGLVELSEDFVFSQQCQKLGYKLYTHYGLACKHIRLVDIKALNDLMIKYGR